MLQRTPLMGPAHNRSLGPGSLVCAWRLQADHGAQVVQIFDSWASHLMPQDFEVFAGPYIKKVIDSFRCGVRTCSKRLL